MKKRIIPSLLLSGGSTNVCLSQSFKPWRTIGTLAQQLKLHVSRNCDELLVINLNNMESSGFSLPTRVVNLVASSVDIPIGYAGGINSSLDAAYCINNCFDKVFLTTSFLNDPSILSNIARLLGSQSIGVILPYKYDDVTGHRFLWDFKLKQLLYDKPLEKFILLSSELGVGEIVLFDVTRDGSLSGLDISIIPILRDLHTSIPILLAGGAGTADHIAQALSCEFIQGVVASSIFALTQETPTTLREFCIGLSIPMRIC
jgi:cyclase